MSTQDPFSTALLTLGVMVVAALAIYVLKVWRRNQTINKRKQEAEAELQRIAAEEAKRQIDERLRSGSRRNRPHLTIEAVMPEELDELEPSGEPWPARKPTPEPRPARSVSSSPSNTDYMPKSCVHCGTSVWREEEWPLEEPGMHGLFYLVNVCNNCGEARKPRLSRKQQERLPSTQAARS